MMEIYMHIGIAVWWSMAVVILGTFRDSEGAADVIAAAIFWPIFAIMGLPVLLWRIPFKTVRTIRADLRNRRILREFESWVDENHPDKSKGAAHPIDKNEGADS